LTRKIDAFRYRSFWLEKSFAHRQGDGHSCPKVPYSQPTEGG
jgi:hypothetical protein